VQYYNFSSPKEWNDGDIIWGSFPKTSRPPEVANEMDYEQGIGHLFSNHNETDSVNRFGFLRGGSYAVAGSEGIYNLYIFNNTFANAPWGFRATSPPQ